MHDLTNYIFLKLATYDLLNYLQKDFNSIIKRPSFQYLINFVLNLNKTCTCTLQLKIGEWRELEGKHEKHLYKSFFL